MNIIVKNLQEWTPISVIIVVASICLGFVIVWDTVNNVALPPYVVGLLSFILGGTGVSAAITHGNNLATSQTDQTAHAAASAAAVTATTMAAAAAAENGTTHTTIDAVKP